MTEARDVADTIHRLRTQADALAKCYSGPGPIPQSVQERIDEKRRAADALEDGLLSSTRADHVGMGGGAATGTSQPPVPSALPAEDSARNTSGTSTAAGDPGQSEAASPDGSGRPIGAAAVSGVGSGSSAAVVKRSARRAVRSS